MERSNQNGLWLTELVSLFVDQSGVKPNTNRNLLACVFPALGSRWHEFLLQGSDFFICFFGGCWDWSELSIKFLRFYRFFFTAGCVFLKAMNRSACLLSFLNLLTFYPSQNNHLKDIQSNPAISKSQGKWKKFEIAGLRNNRGSVKGKGKSKGIRSSFEIAGTSN